MPRKPAKRPRVSDRDYEIFQHLMRYRITTREVLHKLFFSDSDLNAVTKVTSRMTTHGYLCRYDLYTPRSYYVLGPEAARLLGISQNKTKDVGPQALYTEYGTLAYCCLSETPRERMLVREVRERYPELLHRKIDSSHYYLDNDGQTTRLAFIRADHGGSPDHVARKCRQDIDSRRPILPFQRLLIEDRFLIGIVTPTEEKAAAIREVLARQTWPCRFRVEVVPDLIQLMARLSHVD